MFGYVRTDTPELRVRELETYKAVYCSLCRALGRGYGPVARLTLSYDMTFPALVKLALAEDCAGFQKGRCPFNPLKKCSYAKDAGLFPQVAAASVLLSWYKLRDTAADGGFWKRLGARLLSLLLAPAFRKASRREPALAQAAAGYFTAQQTLERDRNASLDVAAEPTAHMLSVLFAALDDRPKISRVLTQMGYLLGKWIYLLDALADREADEKAGNYNVLSLAGPDSGERAKGILCVCLNQLEAALALLPVRRCGGLLENIISRGLPKVQRETLKKEKEA